MKYKIFILAAVLVQVSGAYNQKNSLADPIPVKCNQRPKEFSGDGKNYFFSDHQRALRGKRVGWLEARNYCRKYCMDTLSIDSQQEFEMVKKFLEYYLVDFIWTSGHVCDSNDGCGEINLSKWYWTHNKAMLDPAETNPLGWEFNPWSHTGFRQEAQPDNAEFYVNGKNESCLAVLHNVYDDGIKFHDVACYHKKPFICEDSEELLRLVDVE